MGTQTTSLTMTDDSVDCYYFVMNVANWNCYVYTNCPSFETPNRQMINSLL